MSIREVKYAEIKDLPNHPEKLLIDVREPDELRKTGKIPTSINIPLGAVCREMSPNINAEQFQKRNGRPKPDVNSYIIVYCLSGSRSSEAAQTLADLGYRNVYNYVGSWVDWAEKEGLPKK